MVLYKKYNKIFQAGLGKPQKKVLLLMAGPGGGGKMPGK